MSLNVAVKVDPGDSLAKIKSIEQGLGAMEAKGKSAGQAMVSAAGDVKTLGHAIEQERAAMQRSAEIHDRITRQAQPMAVGFGKIAEQLQREKQMLDQIRAPQMEYFDKLTALDKLLERNAISTKEYAEQVTNLNGKMAEAPEKGGEHEGGGIEHAQEAMRTFGGGAGGLMAGVIGGGAFGAATEGLNMMVESIQKIGEAAREQAEKMREMRDRYVEVANTARKFADEGHTTNQVIKDQQTLAHDLHSTLGATIGVYDAVRDGTDDMNMSYTDTIRLTKTLGESLQLADKPLEDAGRLMQNLSYMMTTGHASAGELTTIMRQVHPIAELWTKHFGLSERALAKMVESGKIKVSELTDALIADGTKQDEKWKGNKRTIADWRAELTDAYTVARGSGQDFASSLQQAFKQTGDASIDLKTKELAAMDVAGGDPMKHAVAAAALYMNQFEDTSKSVAAGAETIQQSIARIADDAKKNADKWKELDDAAHGAQGAMAMLGVIDPLSEGIKGLSNELSILADKLTDLPMNRALGLGQSRAAEVHEAEAALKGLKLAHDMDAKSVVDFEAKQRALLDTIHGVTAGARTQAAEMKKLAAALLGGESPSHRAIEAGAADRAGAQGELDLAAQLEQNTDTGKLDLFNAKLAQLDDLQKRNALSAEAYETAKNKAYEDAFNNGVLAPHTTVDMSGDKTWKDEVAAYEAVYAAQDETIKKAEEASKKFQEAWGAAAGKVAGDMISAFEKGDQSSSKIIEHMLEQLALVALKMGAASIGGPGGAFLGAALSAFSGGGDFSVPHASAGDNWMVRGSGGATDSKLVSFMATPGESVHVRTPSQRAVESGGQSAGDVRIVNNYQDDPRAIAETMSGRQGERVIYNQMRRMRRT